MRSSKLLSGEQIEFLDQAYDVLYNAAQKILDEYNPCGFKDGKCIDKFSNHKPCCPRKCKFLGENGCTTRNLRCKMHLCSSALSNLPIEVENRWWRLNELAHKLSQRFGFIYYAWKSKAELMHDASTTRIYHNTWRIEKIGR